MRLKHFQSVAALTIALLAAPGTAPAQGTLSITGTFKMNQLRPTVGADLASVFANGNDHWWKLTLSGVTYSHEYFFDTWENGGYVRQFITHVHATSFSLEFFGPDAAVLNEVVSGQLNGAFFRLINQDYYDPDYWFDSGPYAIWDLRFSPSAPSGVSLTSYGWEPFTWHPANEDGYPLVQPQRLYSQESLIQDYRNGNAGALSSYNDIVDFGSDQQPLPPLQVDVQDASAPEGDRGTTVMSVTIRLNRAAEQAVMVDYQTANGTAAAPKDYASASDTLTFQPGEVVKTISLSIKGDRAREPNESFTVRLSNAVGANLGGSVGTATILNDD